MGHGMSWSDAKPSSGNKSYFDLIDIQRFTEDWTQIRLIGDVYEIRQHWLPTLRKDGKNMTSFPRLCLKTSDPNADCPYCNAGLRSQTLYLSNAIIRDIQENKPENQKKLAVPDNADFRQKGDTWWSPIRVVQFPSSVAQKIQGYKGLNKCKEDGKCYDLNSKKCGRDITVRIDKTQTGSGMYDIQKEEQNSLSKEERNYLLYDIEKVFDCVENEREAIDTISGVYNKGNFNEDEHDLTRIEEVIGISGSKKKIKSKVDDDDDIPDDDIDEDENPKKKAIKKSKVEDDDSDLDDEDDDLDDDDEDEKPKKKSKKKSKSDDDDDDLDDDEEDEKPKKKSKKSKKSKSDDDDDDDDDLDDDDLDDDDLDDDEEDEKPKKKSKKSKKSKSDDDDDDLDDDDEDEKPKKSSRKSKKSDDDDDDDDDLDDDDEDDLDDDDEDEKPKKKFKKSKKSKFNDDDDEDDDLDDDEEDEKPKKKSKKKSKSDDDDDDLDDDDLDDDEEDEKPRKKKAKRKN